MFLQMIESFKQALSEEDEDEKSVIASLDHVAAKLAEVQVSRCSSNQFLQRVLGVDHSLLKLSAHVA